MSTDERVRRLCDSAPWRAMLADGRLSEDQERESQEARDGLRRLFDERGWAVAVAFCDYAGDLDPDEENPEREVFWRVLGPWLSPAEWRLWHTARAAGAVESLARSR